MVVNTEVQNGYCVEYNILGDNDDFQLYFICIPKNNHKYWMLFAVFTELPQQPDKKKQNMAMQTYKELLGTCIKWKKNHI